ncbi:malonyl-[acyl-carrier protein] O-methyltransferase-like [Saccostrea echinata]|uniref:malonyl-[acyl-carrier protein] O-methyltransferase-like n=1 Tax=Saccostrea echinata TaxID=191078 RepID=UPI002A7FC4A8|nr:malonyl-[acyl-carrier protein] O-methyltransferase-like [Saccostrea echinata]
MSNITDYNEVSRSYDSVRKAPDAHILKGLMENLTGKNTEDLDIIDIGCGTGNYSEYFFQFEPRSLCLMDASEGMLNKAKAKLTASCRTQLSFKQAVLPVIPYEDNSFDAGMINHVLHHIQKNPNGKSFPAVVQTLNETHRILKPGGVLTIIAETPENLEGNWYTNLVPETTKRWRNILPTHKQIKRMLEESGFSLKSTYKTLMASYLPNYDNLEGPLHESWRNVNSFWSLCTEAEIQNMKQNLTQIKNEGTLQAYFEKHDKIYSVGAYDIFAAIKL